jgi:hypothetical protein
MLRRTCWLCALLLIAPAIARANAISLPGGSPFIPTFPNMANQTFSLLLTGTDAYSSSDLKMQINGGVGPAPFITAVFGDTGSLISPPSLFAGSIWSGGSAGITLDPDGTWPTSSGLTTGGGFATPAFAPQTTNGTYLTITFSTVGVPAGFYALTFDGTTMDYIDEEFNSSPVPLQLPTLYFFTPEPSTYALAAIGGVALLAVRRRSKANER